MSVAFECIEWIYTATAHFHTWVSFHPISFIRIFTFCTKATARIALLPYSLSENFSIFRCRFFDKYQIISETQDLKASRKYANNELRTRFFRPEHEISRPKCTLKDFFNSLRRIQQEQQHCRCIRSLSLRGPDRFCCSMSVQWVNSLLFLSCKTTKFMHKLPMRSKFRSTTLRDNNRFHWHCFDGDVVVVVAVLVPCLCSLTTVGSWDKWLGK